MLTFNDKFLSSDRSFCLTVRFTVKSQLMSHKGDIEVVLQQITSAGQKLNGIQN